MFCQICGGKINSLAQSCPHCGNDDFMSVQNSYLDETIISSLVYPDESFSMIWGDMVPKSLKKSEQNSNEMQYCNKICEPESDASENVHTWVSERSQLSSPAKLSAARSLQPASVMAEDTDQPKPVMYLIAGAFGMLVVVAVIILLFSVFKKDDNDSTLEETGSSSFGMEYTESSVPFGAVTNPYQEMNPDNESSFINEEFSQDMLVEYNSCTPAEDIALDCETYFDLQDQQGTNAEFLKESLHITLGISDNDINRYSKNVKWDCEGDDIIVDSESYPLNVVSDSTEKKYCGFSYFGETLFHEVQINDRRSLLSIDKYKTVNISFDTQNGEAGNEISVIHFIDNVSGNTIDLKEYRQDNMDSRYYSYVSPPTENTSLEMTNSTVSAMYLFYELIGGEKYIAVMQFGEKNSLTFYWLNMDGAAYPISVVFFQSEPESTETTESDDYYDAPTFPGQYDHVRPPFSNNPDPGQSTDTVQNPDSGNIPDAGQSAGGDGSSGGGELPEAAGEVPAQPVEGV